MSVNSCFAHGTWLSEGLWVVAAVLSDKVYLSLKQHKTRVKGGTGRAFRCGARPSRGTWCSGSLAGTGPLCTRPQAGVGRLVGERVRSVTQNREGSKAAWTDAISPWMSVPTGTGCSSALKCLLATEALVRTHTSTWHGKRMNERIHCLNWARDFTSLGLMFSHLEIEGVELREPFQLCSCFTLLCVD